MTATPCLASDEDIEAAWADVLVQFGQCSCHCGHRIPMSAEAIAAARELFEDNIKKALCKYGSDHYKNQGGREYVQMRVCKIAQLATALADMGNANTVGADHVRQATETVIEHAHAVLDRLERRYESNKQQDPGERREGDDEHSLYEGGHGHELPGHEIDIPGEDPELRVLFERYCERA